MSDPRKAEQRVWVRNSSRTVDVLVSGTGVEPFLDSVRELPPPLGPLEFVLAATVPARDDPVIHAALASLTPGRVLAIRIEEKQARESGYSAMQLSRETGIKAANLSAMIRGHRPIGPKSANLLAAALECAETDFTAKLKFRDKDIPSQGNPGQTEGSE